MNGYPYLIKLLIDAGNMLTEEELKSYKKINDQSFEASPLNLDALIAEALENK